MENLRNGIEVSLVNNKKDYSNGHQNQVACHKRYWTMIWLQFVKIKLR